MRQKFHMERYYDELGNVEDKLNRIKSEKSTKQPKRDDSKSNLLDATHKVGFLTKQLMDRARTTKENDRQNLRLRAESRLEGRLDGHPSLIDTNMMGARRIRLDDEKSYESSSKAQRKILELQQENQELKERLRKPSVVQEKPRESAKDRRQLNTAMTEEEEIFIRQTNSLYHMSYLSSESPINQLVAELRKRDQIYQIVCERFEGQTTALPKLLQNLMRRERILDQIVTQFKTLSKINIEDQNELLYFLKNG